jgi:uncharacterized protein (UPF0264 family)
MSQKIELIEKSLKKEFPYVVKVNEFKINDGKSPFHSIEIYIKESFFNQLENNSLLKKTIFNSFSKECVQIIKNICPEVEIVFSNDESNVTIKFTPEEVIQQ